MGHEKIRDLIAVEQVGLNAATVAVQQAVDNHNRASAQYNAVLESMALDPAKMYDMRDGALYLTTEGEPAEVAGEPTPTRDPTSEE